jgi:hypothetical protein
MTAKPFADRIADQRRRAIEEADRVSEARALLTEKYKAELAKYLTDEGELRGKALATPPQETK